MDACFLYLPMSPGLNYTEAVARCPILIPTAGLMSVESLAKFNFMTVQYQSDFNAFAQNNQAWVSLTFFCLMTKFPPFY